MTELGEMIWDDGVEQGKQMAAERYSRLILLLSKEQKQMAAERYSRLILLLSKEQKEDLIVKAASDPEYREELYKKYNL